MLSSILAARHDPAARLLNVDLLTVLVAVMLPWTTSGLAIAMVLWIAAVLFTLEPSEFLRSLRRPAALLPIVFFLLAVVGTLWAQGPWPERLHGISPAAKLLAIPLLLYHFQRSQRGHWVLTGFIASCVLLMALSTAVLFVPAWKLGSAADPGVAVKNYLDQGQEFTFCVFALALPALMLGRRGRIAGAAGCIALMLAFLINMVFAVHARTALVLVPVLLVLFMVRHFSARTTAILLVACAVMAVAAWFSSASLRERLLHTVVEYQRYENNFAFPLPDAQSEYRTNSTGLRIEYWKKSLRFFRDAPVLGHGTGMIGRLFEQDAIGKSGAEAEVVRNPHNQTLSVAVQWGTVGIIVLYAMWLSHLTLFRRNGGMAAWIGLLIVVQNFVSSLFNSHLFDFVEGWIYVLGVGIAGGITLAAREGCSE